LSILYLKMLRINPAVLPASEGAQVVAAAATNDSSVVSREGENAGSRPTAEEEDTRVAESPANGLSVVSEEGGNVRSMRVTKDTPVSAADAMRGSIVALEEGGSVCSIPAT
jgi:hypothetical protein